MASMRSVRPHAAYDLTLTLLNPRQRDVIDMSWNVEQAERAYLQVFVNKMKPFVEINVASQVGKFQIIHVPYSF